MSLDPFLSDTIKKAFQSQGFVPKAKDRDFVAKLEEGIPVLAKLYFSLYHSHPQKDEIFGSLVGVIVEAYISRGEDLKKRDAEKSAKGMWFLSNELVGMSLYVDRFAGDLKKMSGKLDYVEELGVNLLHLMPLFESPLGESDGGYAVSDFRKVDPRFGSLKDLTSLRKKMQDKGMCLMLDIVLNHTSHRHEWAEKAKKGDSYYQDFYYMYDNRWSPNQYETMMPEIFPDAAPGNFTWVEECQKWVMTVFHNYQWDLNYMNPIVLREMLDNIFFYANLGVDLLRIDAPAFIWKETGTTSQNLPQVHTLLQLIKKAVQISTPGMAILGEAIVAPKEIIKYFGIGEFRARECDFAYNATHMALQWDMLATGDTKVMLAAQGDILKKPYGTSWINYTRCHDDIGLGYEDRSIMDADKDPYHHRKYLMEYFSGKFPGSPSKGALFSVNPRTGDARISGTLASLCGLEKALESKDEAGIDLSIQKIVLMQAHTFFLGGMPMLYYGDEIGYTNDYSYETDPGKSYDNRWMHRPVVDWQKVERRKIDGTIEQRLFSKTHKLIQIRKNLPLISDYQNIEWMSPHNTHIAGFVRRFEGQQFFGLFNFSHYHTVLSWHAFREKGYTSGKLLDHWSGHTISVGEDHEHLMFQPYGFYLLEVVG